MNLSAGFLALALATGSAGHATATGPLEADPPEGSRSTWNSSLSPFLESRYNDNVFFYSRVGIRRFKTQRPTDPATKRFRGIHAVNDFIQSPGIRVDLRGPGASGRPLHLSFEAEYNVYLRNPAKSYADARVKVRQTLGPKDRVTFAVSDSSHYLYSNTLVGGIDTNANGNIGSAERIYAEERYDEIYGHAEYARTLVPARNHWLGVDGRFTLGYAGRVFESPSPKRNENGAWIRAGVGLSRRAVKLDAAWTVMKLRNAPHAEFVLLDETAFGQDFNVPPDLDATDTHAPTLQTVDRSYRMNKAALDLTATPIAALEVVASWELRVKEFTSGNRFDVAHHRRTDTRQTVGLSLDYRLRQRWHGRLGYEFNVQTEDRRGNPNAVASNYGYRTNAIFLLLTWGTPRHSG